MRVAWLVIAACLLIVALGCMRKRIGDAIVIGGGEEFVDIDLPIADATFSNDGTGSIVARGRYQGAIIGLIVDVLPEWNAHEVEAANINFYFGKARLRGLGAESDAFLSILAKLYGISPAPTSMADLIDVSAAGLSSDPRKLRSSRVDMKLFFSENGDESDYAEVFVNIDLQAKTLEFHEKDPEYRAPLIRALQKTP